MSKSSTCFLFVLIAALGCDVRVVREPGRIDSAPPPPPIDREPIKAKPSSFRVVRDTQLDALPKPPPQPWIDPEHGRSSADVEPPVRYEYGSHRPLVYGPPKPPPPPSKLKEKLNVFQLGFAHLIIIADERPVLTAPARIVNDKVVVRSEDDRTLVMVEIFGDNDGEFLLRNERGRMMAAEGYRLAKAQTNAAIGRRNYARRRAITARENSRRAEQARTHVNNVRAAQGALNRAAAGTNAISARRGLPYMVQQGGYSRWFRDNTFYADVTVRHR